MSEPKKKAGRTFVIFTERGRFTVAAKTLARAVENAGVDERQTPIVAAIEAECVPAPSDNGLPFLAVLLRNPYFKSEE